MKKVKYFLILTSIFFSSLSFASGRKFSGVMGSRFFGKKPYTPSEVADRFLIAYATAGTAAVCVAKSIKVPGVVGVAVTAFVAGHAVVVLKNRK